MTERAQSADVRRKPQIFADSPLLLEIQAFGGRRKPQKTADFRRKPKIFAENRRKPQIGLRHLRCVTFSSALLFFEETPQIQRNTAVSRIRHLLVWFALAASNFSQLYLTCFKTATMSDKGFS